MLSKILSMIGLGDGSLNGEVEARRRYARHAGQDVEVVVANRVYSVKDWSYGGVSFETLLDAPVNAGDSLQMTIRFRFPHETVSITQPGRVVRAARRGIAAEFQPLSKEIRRKFDRALDYVHTRDFMESQVA